MQLKAGRPLLWLTCMDHKNPVRVGPLQSHKGFPKDPTVL